MTLRYMLFFPLYPLFIALYFPVMQWALNFHLFPFWQLHRPLLVLAVAYIILLAVNYLLLMKNWHRAGFSTLMILLVAVYGDNSDKLDIFLLALFFVGVFCLDYHAIHDRHITLLLNIFAVVMFLQAVYDLGRVTTLGQGDAFAHSQENRFFADPPGIQTKKLPNIVHIVLDGYNRSDVLKRYYNFDNSLFLHELEGMGFRIFSNARAPANQTLFAMSSVYSGDYIDLADVSHLQNRILRHRLGRFLHASPVAQWLNTLGYHTTATDSGYSFIQAGETNRKVQALVWQGINPFESYLLQFSALGRLFINHRNESLLQIDNESKRRKQPCINQINCLVKDAFDTPLPKKSPFLYYQHVLAPHPPFTLDREGREIMGEINFRTIADGDHAHKGIPEQQKLYLNGYLDKLHYVNGAVLKQLHSFLEQIPKPFIILLQSDHGGGLMLDADSARNSCVKERLGILMAVYASESDTQKILEEALTIQPNSVNLYRAVFNTVHDSHIQPLPNKSFFFGWNKPLPNYMITDEEFDKECKTPWIR
jgi:hypothetical protein